MFVVYNEDSHLLTSFFDASSVKYKKVMCFSSAEEEWFVNQVTPNYDGYIILVDADYLPSHYLVHLVDSPNKFILFVHDSGNNELNEFILSRSTVYRRNKKYVLLSIDESDMVQAFYYRSEEMLWNNFPQNDTTHRFVYLVLENNMIVEAHVV